MKKEFNVHVTDFWITLDGIFKVEITIDIPRHDTIKRWLEISTGKVTRP